MKVDREIIHLEKSIQKGDFATARHIIEGNIELFSKPYNRTKLSIEALTLLNCVVDLNDESNKDVYSRETQLIIHHLNTLAHECRFAEIKRFEFLYKDLLNNPKIYGFLNADAKALISPPKTEQDVVSGVQ